MSRKKRNIVCEVHADNRILVNNKHMQMDMNGNWTGDELDQEEKEYFRKFVSVLSESNLKLQKATFVVR